MEMGRILTQWAHGIEQRCRGDDGNRELKSLQSGGGRENFRIARNRSQCRRSWGWSPGLAAVGCLALLMVGRVCEATYMLERHRRDRACSLMTNDRAQLNPNEFCTALPVGGNDLPADQRGSGVGIGGLATGVDQDGRLLLSFGESDCKFTARFCMVGYCYVLSDFSSLLHRDVDVSRIMALADLEAPSGVFKNVSAVGADIFVSPNGIHITPTQAEVTLTYSTKTCAEFYQDFGREWPQTCSGVMGLAGQINMLGVVGSPEGFTCISGLPDM